MLEAIGLSAVLVLVHMTLFYIVSRVEKNYTFADVGWGLGFVFVALLTFWLSGTAYPQQVLVTTFVILWGLRISNYLFYRIWRLHKAEDFRYRRMRKDWGEKESWRSFVNIFMLQGALLLFISLPVIYVNSNPTSGLSLWQVLGATVWLIGFFFEAIGDLQLLLFKRNPDNKGKILTTGLWRYTRHPNYFGEVTLWWGIWLMTLPGGWWTLAGPALITYLILRVSGIPLLEEHYKDDPKYAEYRDKTPRFLPWFPD